MQKNKINLKKENYLYKLNITHETLMRAFSFINADKVITGEIRETTVTSYNAENKKEYKTTLKSFEYIEGIFKEEFQIELLVDGETYDAFYSLDEDGEVYINKYEYLNLVKIFEKIDYEVETNLMDLRVMGIDFLSSVLATAFYKNEIFILEMKEEDYKQERESIKDRVVSYEEVIAQGLLNGKKIRIYDHQEFKEHWITIDMLQNGLEVLKKDYPKTYSNIINDEYDLVDGDMLIQCTLFGDVIYG